MPSSTSKNNSKNNSNKKSNNTQSQKTITNTIKQFEKLQLKKKHIAGDGEDEIEDPTYLMMVRYIANPTIADFHTMEAISKTARIYYNLWTGALPQVYARLQPNMLPIAPNIDILKIEYNNTGHYIAYITRRVVSIWRTTPVPLVQLGTIDVTPNYAFKTFVWSPDGTRIATLDTSGIVRVWNITTQPFQQIFETAPAPEALQYVGGDIHPLTWSPDGQYIAYCQIHQNIIRIISANNGHELHSLNTLISADDQHEHIATILWSPDGTRLAYYKMRFPIGQNIVILSVANWQQIGIIGDDEHRVSKKFKWSPDSTKILAEPYYNREGATLNLWNTQTYQFINELVFFRNPPENIAQNMNLRFVTDFTWNRDGSQLAVSITNYTMQIWATPREVSNWRLIRDVNTIFQDGYVHHQHIIDNIAWSPINNRIALGRYWDHIRIIVIDSISGGGDKHTYKGRKYVIRISPRGKRFILVGTTKRKIYI